MVVWLIITFVLGYLAIIFEHVIHINKTASALLTGILCWVIISVAEPGTDLLAVSEIQAYLKEHITDPMGFQHYMHLGLSHHLSEIAEILFFLLGAMTIVELMDAHGSFRIITDRISTTSPIRLLWIVGILAFVLAAVLDSLATAIIMVTLLRKLVSDKELRMFFAGIVVIAANAGGAFSPIGNVTTTMLWIGGQISISQIMLALFIPSLVCLLVPMGVITWQLNGKKYQLKVPQLSKQSNDETPLQRNTMFFAGVGVLLFVPIFKAVTHLPPYMGMMLALGVLWVISEFVNYRRDEALKQPYTVGHALSKIDSTSIIFFLGILLSISALESTHILSHLATWLSETLPNLDVVVIIIGLASAIIDNVPLVAASMGMFSLEQYPMDDQLWHLLAYCAGTGGSILIIGSAAGVAVMGMEKLSFVWYVKKISFLAFIGYVAGIITYLALT